MPGELRRQQTANCAFARAHKSSQANQAAFRGNPRIGPRNGPRVRLVQLGWIVQAIPSALVTLQNLDYTTKGREFDFGVPVVHCANEALSPLGLRVGASVRVRLKRRRSLVDHVALERGGAQIE